MSYDTTIRRDMYRPGMTFPADQGSDTFVSSRDEWVLAQMHGTASVERSNDLPVWMPRRT